MIEERWAHPELDRLADFEAGLLDEAGAADVARHAKSCLTCRLELKRLKRFNTIDSDRDLAAEAGWPAAEAELERMFPERVLGKASSHARSVTRPGGFRWPKLWLVPATAAAAVLLILVFHSVRQAGPDFPRDHSDLVRGGTGTQRSLVPLAPAGALAEVPDRFTWRSSQPFDSVTVEVLAPGLETIFVQSGITGTSWPVPPALRSLLGPGRTYLWRLQGHRGLTAPEVSVHAWFRLPATPGND